MPRGVTRAIPSPRGRTLPYFAMAAGSIISVANSATLSAYPTTGLVIGAIAFVQSRGTYWSYQPNSSGPAGGTCIAASGGGFWEYVTTGTAADAIKVAGWYIDSQNASGTASDDNDGETRTTALLTLAEIFRRIGTKSPVWQQQVTITYLSSGLSTDAWAAITPLEYMPIVTAPFGGYAGTPAATVTLGTYTPINPSAGVNARATITAEGESGAFWTPYVGKNYLVIGPNYYFHLGTDLGDATAAIDNPMKLPMQQFPGVYATPANGDTLHIYAQPSVYVDEIGQGSWQLSGDALAFVALDLTSNFGTYVDNSSAEFRMYGCTTSNNDMVVAIGPQGSIAVLAFGTHFNEVGGGGGGFEGAGIFYACGFDGAGVTFYDQTTLDGDTWVNERIHMGNSGSLYLCRAGFGQVNDTDGGRIEWTLRPSYFGTSRVYGAGINVAVGSTMRNGSGTTYATALAGLTNLYIDGGTTACAWNGTGFDAAAAFTAASCDSASQYSPSASGSYIAVS